MKLLSMFLLAAATWFGQAEWGTDFEKAKSKAKAEQKLVLVNFSGSDWCAPCIKMKKNIFEQTVFTDYADANLVLVRADFPRSKKNKLDKNWKTEKKQSLNNGNIWIEKLTKREIEIIKLIALQMNSSQISEKLFLSYYTVKTHRKNILQKLELKNTAGLIEFANKNNLL